MKKWLIGAMTALIVVSLTACTPTAEKQKKEIVAAVVAKSQEDMVPPSTDGADDKVPGPNAISVAVISIYRGGGRSLVQDMNSPGMEGLDTQLPMGKLIEYGVLADGTEVLSFDIEGKDKNAVGTLDLSQAESAEGCSDKMFLTGVGDTFTENFGLSKFKLKTNGGNYEGDGIKQGDSDYLTYNADYESIE